MKYLLLASLFALFSISGFAESKQESEDSLGETQTECPWMKEMNKRTNTKLHLLDSQPRKRANEQKSVISV